MSIIPKNDVANPVQPPFNAKIHLCPPVSQPDATGFSEPEPDAMIAAQSSFASDFVAEHSSPDVATAPDRHLPDSFHPEALTAPKSAKG